ncbi:hypothetical protein [Deinococcus hopiensis]|uniref:Uncharacterized protein n=1 Tax=Deinococcus hopiensis KR-140 TaxID=695939 RepID=A0A1W1VVS7_9DEIO|nr:hypothetical protein [Deinococcus hopiensis]SMB97211.1 hypothetical protein SAMN00790413_06416 [Deinococcus hopiensis KR-140]
MTAAAQVYVRETVTLSEAASVRRARVLRALQQAGQVGLGRGDRDRQRRWTVQGVAQAYPRRESAALGGPITATPHG